MDHDGKVSILIVDDKPDKVLALEAVLEDLGQNIVCAYSGREALRALLTQDFAVILLDVNMPGMDGFETAALLRQRKQTQDTPIIFVTAFSDEMHLSRGYSLGAVDYILAPVVPEVLKTKVSVFVDLYRKTEQVRRQAEWLRQRATQLHKLTSASLAINSAGSIERMLEVVTDTARDVIGAHQAAATVLPEGHWVHGAFIASLSDKYSQWREAQRRPDEWGLHDLLRGLNKAVRMTRAELERHPTVLAADRGVDRTPLSGWMASPLKGRDGRYLGLIEVSDKLDGDFTEDDEAILIQLSQMASIAIENTIYAQERETNRIKDEFLATLSHELRTPLNAILGWTQLLRMEKLEGEVAHGLEVVERNARAQAKLIEDLLDVSRIVTGKLRISRKQTPLAPVIEAAADAVKPTAEAKGVRLDVELLAEQDIIDGDADRLQQVIWNLLSNAVKFTPGEGRVSVSLERLNGHLQVQVTDSGRGIHPKFLPYVFDRFRQADSTSTRAHGGLGIGLTIVRHIVELHGGTVEAYSAGEGKGATFTVKLPLVVDSTEAKPAASTPAMRSRGGAAINPVADLSSVLVLVVDDEPDAREMVATTLRRAGAEVRTAGSMREALEVFLRVRPQLLLSDIGMPHQDGYDLIRAVRELHPEQGGSVPAIALTAYAREEDRLRVLAAGYQMHLAKPVDPASLVSAVAYLAPAAEAQEVRKLG